MEHKHPGTACTPEASPRVTEVAQGDCVGQEAGPGQRLSRPSTTKGPQRKKSRGWKDTRRMQGHRRRVSEKEWLTASDAMKKPNEGKIKEVRGNEEVGGNL